MVVSLWRFGPSEMGSYFGLDNLRRILEHMACRINHRSPMNNISIVLMKLHDGDAINDEELDETITCLTAILEVFTGLRIPSMPEYDVFSKALRKDCQALVDFKFSREKNLTS